MIGDFSANLLIYFLYSLDNNVFDKTF